MRVLFLMNQRFFQLFELLWLVLQGELFNAVKADDCFWSLGANLEPLCPLWSSSIFTGIALAYPNDQNVFCDDL